jgi:hypothetical protein
VRATSIEVNLLAVSFCVISSLSLGAPRHGTLLIRHAAIIDVEHARTIPDQAVVTRGGDIVAVGNDAAIARDWRTTRTIDATNRFLIPGLWDMHVHFGGGSDLIEENRALLPLYIAHGIATIRDCSGDLPDQVLAWREEIATRKLFGPTLLTSGPKIEGIKPIWKGTIECGSRDNIDAAIKRLKRLRVDFVKITDSTLDPQLFLYAVSRAKMAGFRTSGHIPMADTVSQAIDAGISSIEHLDYAFKAGAKDDAATCANRGCQMCNPQFARMRRSRQISQRAALIAPKPIAASTPALIEQRQLRRIVISRKKVCSSRPRSTAAASSRFSIAIITRTTVTSLTSARSCARLMTGESNARPKMMLMPWPSGTRISNIWPRFCQCFSRLASPSWQARMQDS